MPSRTAAPSASPSRERASRNRAAHAHAAPVAQVRQDAQADLAAGELGDAIGHGLGHGVHQVGAHRVAAVDQEVHDEHAVAEVAHLEPARTAAATHQVGHRGVGARAGARPCARARSRTRPSASGTSSSCTWAIMIGSSDSADEAAARADHARGVGGGGDDGRLLDDHRHQVVLAVHLHVEGEREGQRVGADHVLDHLVGDVARRDRRDRATASSTAVRSKRSAAMR